MAIGNVGGGRQFGDGNLKEVVIGALAAPATATVTATLTAAQLSSSLLVASPGTGAATYTLPTVALFDAAVSNAKIGSTVALSIVNLGTSSGVITMAVGTGWTIVGLATIAIATSAQFLARKSSDTAWVLYRV